MTDGPAVIELHQDIGAPAHISSFLGALSIGTAFFGVYDEHDYLRYANQPFLKSFNVEQGSVSTFDTIVTNAFRTGFGPRIETSEPVAFIRDAQCRRRILPVAPNQRSFPIDFSDGSWFWCTETLLRNGWIVLTGADITKLKEDERVLSAGRDRALFLSGVDELTGVDNRRAALMRLDAMLHSPNAERDGICAALVDLDNFKLINDRFGHETGDLALRHFAQFMSASFPPPASISRWGGEEFLILIPSTHIQTVKTKLEAALSDLPFQGLRLPVHGQIPLAFSAGVARVLRGETHQNLLARADQALYLAKRNGRGRVEAQE